MLTELSIKNFAIIEELSLSFHEGLTVLTGETGAGKSIIIDAIQLLAGARGSVDFVRHESNKAEIEGLFFIDHDRHPVYQVGKAYGVEISDEQIVLQRTITSSGKSICRVNSKLVTLAILREFGKTLIDIHSQHETQSLMDNEQHIDFLDLYLGDTIREAKKDYQEIYYRLEQLKKKYRNLNDNEQEMAQRLDLLQFQQQELTEAHLVPNEDVEIEEERNQLANYEKIHKSLSDAYHALYGEQRGLDLISQAQLSLQDGSDLDPFIAEKLEGMSNHYYMLEEITFEIRNYLDQLQYNPERLNELEQRMDELNRLKRKYGPTVEEMLDYLGRVEEEIEQITNRESHLNTLVTEIEELEKDALLEAEQLHHLRKQAAEQLTNDIHRELKDLYLEKTTFSIDFEDSAQRKLKPNGYDKILFRISTNVGEPLKDLTKIASGGELSRIMLALKKIFSKHQGITSVIFDEVDTGVSGRVAQAIAEKIHEISLESQVLCITHLPQVAAMADTHKFIQKKEKANRTFTSVVELTGKDLIEELSRMITGTKLTETAKEHAKEMLTLASSFKKSN
ncbi:DNA repair protein RecN [Oceanobacillus sp. J11TS1]|uniref:DNA repair protein RecN n=1 Tax=Oceanobacillus sp. J11TS1 TaxID=2807191 RepID=UPI001B0E348D|nr:DNA repair protein RecN [Oceanobacillus sp. J11TS1]GIO23180.1 DNA repair protein RecN [Oceanobacillus sp. J11TS1]